MSTSKNVVYVCDLKKGMFQKNNRLECSIIKEYA